MAEWVMGNIVQVKYWTERLFSLIVHAPVNSFTAGQFTKLSLDINGTKVQRAYSYVNAPQNKNLEFYIIVVSQGKLSPMLHRLQSRDNLMITKDASGFFVLREIPPCKNLWMLATGTAVGPYLSILEQFTECERFTKIILVHAVRFARDLSYFSQMQKLEQRFNGKLRILTVVSREKVFGSLTGRLPALLDDGSIEKAVNLKLQAENSHVMLCGNPEMVRDMHKLLKDTRSMYKNFKHHPGHVSSENYW